MANLYGANYTKAYISNPPVIVDQANFDCKVKCSYDSYSNTAAIADGSIIYLQKLPKGARVIDVILHSTDQGGTAQSLACGFSDDADAFIAAADNSGQAVKAFADAAAAGVGVVLSEEKQVIVTATGLGVATSGKIEVFVEYMLD